MMLHSLSSVFPFMVCLFWTAVFLLGWRSSNPARRMLTVFMAACTVLYFCHAAFFHQEQAILPVTDTLYALCNLSVFPLFYLYVLRLTTGSLSPRHWLVLAPAFVVAVWSVALNVQGEGHALRTTVAQAIFLLQLLPICWFSFKRLNSFDRRLEDYFADTETRSVAHIRSLMLMLVVCAFCSAVASRIGRDYFFLHPTLLAVPSLLFGVLLFSIGYLGLRQQFGIEDILTEEAEPEESPQEAEEAKTPALIEELNRLMSDERMYLNADLRLSDVASRLGVSRTTLSASINKSMEMSFSDFINTQRILHAQRIMTKQPSLSLLQISESSGFTTESSFYRAFRKHTGMTPRQWKETGVSKI